MAKISKAEAQLRSVTGTKRRENEPENEYLLRLVQAIADLPEADWNKLDESMQAWFNAAAEAVNNGRAPEPLPTVVEPVAVEKNRPASSTSVKQKRQAKVKRSSGIETAINLACSNDFDAITVEQLAQEAAINKAIAANALYWIRKVVTGLRKAGKLS